MKKKCISIIYVVILTICLIGCNYSIKKYDEEFRNYLIKEYNLELNDISEVDRCHSNCDYYGYYVIGSDYNYPIQISKTKNEYEVSYDKDAVDKRMKLYKYIKDARGDDFASNYLGFYKNTYSGHISYSSGDGNKLYYIIKYNDSMKLEEELKKDYDILRKAQDILGDYKVKEMIVLYIKDSKLDDEDWIKKLDINISELSDIIYDSNKFLNKYKYSYRISNYDTELSLAKLSYKEFEELVNNKIEKN